MIYIIEKKLDPNSINNEISWSIYNGNIKNIEKLISSGFDIDTVIRKHNERRIYEATPITLAVLNNNLDLVKFFFINGANLHIKDSDGKTPLEIAIEHGSDDIVKYLKERI